MSNIKLSPSLKEGICPECGSRHVKSGVDVPDKSGDGGGNRIPINAVFAAPLDNYVCVDCGYMESYILDRAILNRIANEWEHVPVLTTNIPGDSASDAKDTKTSGGSE